MEFQSLFFITELSFSDTNTIFPGTKEQNPYTVELRYNEVRGVHGFYPRYIRGEGYNAGRPPPFRRVETHPPPPPHFRYIAKLAFKNKVVSQGIRQ